MKQFCVKLCDECNECENVIFVASKEVCEEFCMELESIKNEYGDPLYYVSTVNYAKSIENVADVIENIKWAHRFDSKLRRII